MNNNSEIHPQRVAIYLRVSTDDQAEKYGLDLQKEAVDGLIKSKGKLPDGENALVLAGDQYIYIDDGISGTIILDERPAFAKLKEDIVLAPEGQRPFDIVAVYKIDRFARKLKILLDVIDFFEKYNIQFISANESIDTSTPFGKAMLGIIGVIAELEIETIRQRTQAGREEAMKRGIVMGSNTPFGYTKSSDKTLVVFEPEAKFVHLIFDKFIEEGYSLQQIANYLGDHDILSRDASAIKYGKRSGYIKKRNKSTFWRPEQVREILQDEVYIGKYFYGKVKKGKKLSKDEWSLSPRGHTSIIDLIQFERAQSLLKLQAPLIRAQRVDHTYLLSGLLKCDHCKDNVDDLIAWTGTKKKLKKGVNAGEFSFYYMCSRKNVAKYSSVCEVMPIPAEPIERYIVDLTKELLKNPVGVYNHQLKLKSTQSEIRRFRTLREDLQKLLNNIPERRNRLKEQHEFGIIDTPTLQKEIAGLESKEQKFQTELLEIEKNIAKSYLSKGYEESLSLFSEKYRHALDDLYNNRNEILEILHILVDKIVVYSRPVTKKDKLAGRKKDKQQIPYRVEMKFRLPKDIMINFASRFGVENADLWAIRDSNP